MNYLILFISLYNVQTANVLQTRIGHIPNFAKNNLEKLLEAENKYKYAFHNILDKILKEICSILNEINNPENLINKFKEYEIVSKRLSLINAGKLFFTNINDIIIKGKQNIEMIYYELQFYDFLLCEIFIMPTDPPRFQSKYKKNNLIYYNLNNLINDRLNLLHDKIIITLSFFSETHTKESLEDNNEYSFEKISKIYSLLTAEIDELRNVKMITNKNSGREFENQLAKYNNAHVYFSRKQDYDGKIYRILTYIFWHQTLLESINESFKSIDEENEKMKNNNLKLTGTFKYFSVCFCAKLNLLLYFSKYITLNVKNLKISNHKSIPSEIYEFNGVNTKKVVFENCEYLLNATDGLFFGEVFDDKIFNPLIQIKECAIENNTNFE